MLPGFCCCWRVACILAVDCFPSVAGTVADDPFLLAGIPTNNGVSADAVAPAVAGISAIFGITTVAAVAGVTSFDGLPAV